MEAIGPMFQHADLVVDALHPAIGQAKAQETITQTLTSAYLRYKLYDSPNSKLILLPDQLKAPILINPGEPPSEGRREAIP